MKCKGTELSIKKKNSHLRLGLIFLIFFQLGIPMSSQTFFRCAASISSRVGATNNCIQRFEAPSNNVERILMPTWDAVPIIFTRLQSPLYSVMRPLSERMPYLEPRTVTRMKLASKTIIEIVKAVHKTMCLLECQIRQLLIPLA